MTAAMTAIVPSDAKGLVIFNDDVAMPRATRPAVDSRAKSVRIVLMEQLI